MVNERLQGREKLYSKNALLLGQNEIQKLYEFNSLIQKLYTRFARSCFWLKPFYNLKTKSNVKLGFYNLRLNERRQNNPSII